MALYLPVDEISACSESIFVRDFRPIPGRIDNDPPGHGAYSLAAS